MIFFSCFWKATKKKIFSTRDVFSFRENNFSTFLRCAFGRRILMKAKGEFLSSQKHAQRTLWDSFNTGCCVVAPLHRSLGAKLPRCCCLLMVAFFFSFHFMIHLGFPQFFFLFISFLLFLRHTTRQCSSHSTSLRLINTPLPIRFECVAPIPCCAHIAQPTSRF